MADKNSYQNVMARKNEIMKSAVGIDYEVFESGSIAFDYDRMMKEAAYNLDEIIKIQSEYSVGNTPII